MRIPTQSNENREIGHSRLYYDQTTSLVSKDLRPLNYGNTISEEVYNYVTHKGADLRTVTNQELSIYVLP